MENTNIRSRHERQPFQPEAESMSMMDAVKSVFNKYADFTGRARRSEYWYWYLFTLISSLAILFLAVPFAIAESEVGLSIVGLLLMVWFIGTIIPTLAVVVRRLHDTGRSGWSYFISLIPIAGPIILIIWLVEDSHTGPNQWGANPKGIGNDDFNKNQF